MENSNNQNQNHSLQNTENYKSSFTCSSTEIFTKYIGILSEYFINCSENINIQNETYYKYVIIKGMETVAHVFRMLLLYTKNLNLTYYHCQKSFYYYVEFISQIGDNNHSFLQLNSRDASLFVYKKTIYEINQEFRRSFTSTVTDNIIVNNVDIMIYIYNNVIIETLDMTQLQPMQQPVSNIKNMNPPSVSFACDPITPSPSVVHSPVEGNSPIHSSIKTVDDDTTNKKGKKRDMKLLTIDKEAIKLAQIIMNVSLSGDENYFYSMLQIIKYFFDRMDLKNKNKFIYVDMFIKKIKKNDDVISIQYLEKRFRHDEHDNKFETLTPLRYMNWLMLDV